MNYYYTNIIKSIKSLYSDYEFPNHIYNRGVDLYESGAVSDVVIVSDKLVAATVKDTKNYHVEISDNGSFNLNYKCTCEYKRNCKHVVALVQYIKANYNRLEVDYLIANNNLSKSDYILALFNKYLKILSTSYRVSEEDINLTYKLIILIVDKMQELLEETDIELNYDLYFLLFSRFTKINIYEDDVIKAIDLLLSFLYKLMKKNSSEFLKSWSGYLKANELKNMYFLIEKAIQSIKDLEEAEGFKRFLDYTLNLVRNNKVYIFDSKNRNIIINGYVNQIVLFIGVVLNNFYSEDEYLSYLEKNAIGLENVEIKYINEMFYNNKQDRLLSYLEKNKRNFSLGKIVYKGLILNKKLISTEEYKKDVLSLFGVNPKVEDFIYIHKLTPLDLFQQMLPKLLSYAKKTNKYDYYEIEIYLDEDNGYNILKEAGIFEFDKHLRHFLPKYEEDIICYYQEQLTDHFKKVKGLGVKFDNAMEAIRSLSKMSNGRYYVYSIYRTARASLAEYETTEALEQVYGYIQSLEL